MSLAQRWSVFVVAGEASADIHAAALVRELKCLNPDISFFGVGSQELAKEGMEISFDARELSVVGLTDWFDKASEIVSVYRRLSRLIRDRRPDVAILLDLPDFNLRMAKKLKRLDVPVVYYISPQVWAWRTYRVNAIRKRVERMLVVFPFEQSFYEKHGVSAHFVGHPLLDTIRARSNYRGREERLKTPRIALLPGSRKSELRYHAPLLVDTVKKVVERYPSAEFRVPVAPTLPLALAKELLSAPNVFFEEGNSRAVLAWSDTALVASGTATLETALVGTPFCLFYKLSRSSAFFFQRVWRYQGFLGMPNLLHGKEVARELFQQKATPKSLAEECIRLLEDESYREASIANLRRCHELLGTSGASRRAAEQVIDVLSRRQERARSLLEPSAVLS